MGEPGDGEGADGVLPVEVVFPVTQPVKQDGESAVAHLYVFVWIQEAHPVVLVAVLFDASFHGGILQPRTLILRDGLGRNVREIEDFFGDIIIVDPRMGRESWVGPIIIYIEFSDAVMIVVVGEKFPELDGNIFHEETWRI